MGWRSGRGRRVRRWSLLVPLTAAAAGLLFATSASTAQGTDLRADRRLQLTEFIARERADVAAREREATDLREQIDASAAQVAGVDGEVRAAAPPFALEVQAGLVAVTGPGVEVVLDDAPRRRGRPALTADNDDLVVHQQDLEAVVNALWAGGAEALTVMGQRVVSTSAVRCVGPTVLVNGRLFTPPYVVTAVGDPTLLREAIDREPGVGVYREFVDAFGLRFDVKALRATTAPAYVGPLGLPNIAPAQP